MEQTFSYGLVENYSNQEDVLQDIFSLRYQVYVSEWEFEAATDHPDELESDEYDEHSIHYFAQDKSDYKVIATARIILHSELGFPIEKNFDIDEQYHGIKKNQIGEISRLAVSKKYRKCAIDRAIFGTGKYDPNHIPRDIDDGKDARRHCEHELVRGLYMSIYRDSKQRELTHWYAVMAKGLYVILKRWGISFKQVGPTKDYHGVRSPYLVSIESVEKAVAKANPELLEEARRAAYH
jgi:N-acyl amino acid synthase of PEP-CTERM/exosortase system